MLVYFQQFLFFYSAVYYHKFVMRLVLPNVVLLIIWSVTLIPFGGICSSFPWKMCKTIITHAKQQGSGRKIGWVCDSKRGQWIQRSDILGDEIYTSVWKLNYVTLKISPPRIRHIRIFVSNRWENVNVDEIPTSLSYAKDPSGYCFYGAL